MSRSDLIQLCHDPIYYPFVQTNTTKISNSECHLNDLLNKITMNKEHKIHHNTSASNCNNIILFVMLDKNQFVAFSGNSAVEKVKIVDCFSESIQAF